MPEAQNQKGANQTDGKANPPKKRRLRKDRLALLVIACLCVAILCGGVFIYVRQEYRFIIKDVLSNFGKQAAELGEVTPETEEKDISEFISDIRVTENDSLMLINTKHLLSDSYSPDISEYKDSDVFMNSCILSAYEDISKEVFNRYNEKLYVSSAWRTASEQEEAIVEEGDAAQQVGASEHQAGLAIDVYTMYHAGMAFLDGEPGQWVNKNAWLFGFIIRYPYNGKGKTGISYEPWHLRFVGEPHAEIIMTNGITLEEYIDSLAVGKFYSLGDYTVTRQSGPQISVLKNYSSAVISPDNCGNYIITFKS